MITLRNSPHIRPLVYFCYALGMHQHWKRAAEFASPLCLIPFFYTNMIDPFHELPLTWSELLREPFSPCWLLMVTGLAWIAAIIVLRPLTSVRLHRRDRFGFVVALIGSWAFALYVLHASRTGSTTTGGGLRDVTLEAFIPAALLAWGVRERLRDQMIDGALCRSCGYSLAGLAKGAVCPECGNRDGANDVK